MLNFNYHGGKNYSYASSKSRVLIELKKFNCGIIFLFVEFRYHFFIAFFNHFYKNLFKLFLNKFLGIFTKKNRYEKSQTKTDKRKY